MILQLTSSRMFENILRDDEIDLTRFPTPYRILVHHRNEVSI
jgi:hypothetical protein